MALKIEYLDKNDLKPYTNNAKQTALYERLKEEGYECEAVNR